MGCVWIGGPDVLPVVSAKRLEHAGLRAPSDNWVLQVLAICGEAVLAFCSSTYCERVSSSSCDATVLGGVFQRAG